MADQDQDMNTQQEETDNNADMDLDDAEPQTHHSSTEMNPVEPSQTTSTPSSKTRKPKPVTERLPITVPEKPTPYTLDLGHLLLLDPNPLPTPLDESTLSTHARSAAQHLLNTLLTTCPIHSTPHGVHITLPPPTTPLPREKPLPPASKPVTKWESFAARKGIKDTKRRDERGKMVYDDAKGEWVPKWGFKGRNKEGEGSWLVEVDERKERDRERGEGKGGGKGKGQKQGKSEGGQRADDRRTRKEVVRRQERRVRANEARGRKGRAVG